MNDVVYEILETTFEPLPDEILKHCARHGRLTRKDVVANGKNESGTQSWKCRQCLKIYHSNHYSKHSHKIKEYKEKNKDKVRVIKAKSYQKNKHKYGEKAQAYNRERRKDPVYLESERERKRRNDRRSRETLSDAYIKKLIIRDEKISKYEIPQEMVELKRVNYLLNKEISKIKEKFKK